MKNRGLTLLAPRLTPALDRFFCPAVLANHAFEKSARTAPGSIPIRLGLEQSDGSVSIYETMIFAQTQPDAAGDFSYLERLLKLLLWSRGGFRIYFDGPRSLGEQLQRYYSERATGKFDAHVMGERIYERPFEIRITNEFPPARSSTIPLGRHLDGCRIGFDLGGSDRKVAALIEGELVFSEETPWDPYFQK